jgi:hypothetical protein
VTHRPQRSEHACNMQAITSLATRGTGIEKRVQ